MHSNDPIIKADFNTDQKKDPCTVPRHIVRPVDHVVPPDAAIFGFRFDRDDDGDLHSVTLASRQTIDRDTKMTAVLGSHFPSRKTS
jgi:hypothetical protein